MAGTPHMEFEIGPDTMPAVSGVDLTLLSPILQCNISLGERVDLLESIYNEAEALRVEVVYSGSNAEGLSWNAIGPDKGIPISDKDALLVVPDYLAITNEQHHGTDIKYKDNTSNILEICPTSRLVFVKLFDIKKKYIIPNEFKNHCMEKYISILDNTGAIPNSFTSLIVTYIQLLRKKNIVYDIELESDYEQAFKKLEPHQRPYAAAGPATRNEELLKIKADMDYVWAIKLLGWPTIAADWQVRKRGHGWPSDQLINEAVSHSCYLVPVGSKTDTDRKSEWRYSFSAQEKILAKSLSIIQRQCYWLLRQYIKHYVTYDTPRESNVPSVLSTYFLKTMLFLTIENVPQHMWTSQNICSLVLLMIEKLMDCYTRGFLGHYFVPEFNLIEHVDTQICSGICERLLFVRKNPQVLLRDHHILLGIPSLNKEVSCLWFGDNFSKLDKVVVMLRALRAMTLYAAGRPEECMEYVDDTKLKKSKENVLNKLCKNWSDAYNEIKANLTLENKLGLYVEIQFCADINPDENEIFHTNSYVLLGVELVLFKLMQPVYFMNTVFTSLPLMYHDVGRGTPPEGKNIFTRIVGFENMINVLCESINQPDFNTYVDDEIQIVAQGVKATFEDIKNKNITNWLGIPRVSHFCDKLLNKKVELCAGLPNGIVDNFFDNVCVAEWLNREYLHGNYSDVVALEEKIQQRIILEGGSSDDVIRYSDYCVDIVDLNIADILKANKKFEAPAKDYMLYIFIQCAIRNDMKDKAQTALDQLEKRYDKSKHPGTRLLVDIAKIRVQV